jgi:hypothetical protein
LARNQPLSQIETCPRCGTTESIKLRNSLLNDSSTFKKEVVETVVEDMEKSFP